MLGTLVRHAVRLVAVLLVIATVVYLADGLAEPASLASFERALEGIFAWLNGLFQRVADLDLQMSDVGLDDLGSVGDWFDAVRGVFGGSDSATTTTVAVDAAGTGEGATG